jgi:hypothetical protein
MAPTAWSALSLITRAAPAAAPIPPQVAVLWNIA